MTLLKETKNVGCVFQDVETPRPSSILRTSSTTTKKYSGYVEKESATSKNRETCFGCFFKYTPIGLRIPGYGAAKIVIDFTEELHHSGTNPMCSFH